MDVIMVVIAALAAAKEMICLVTLAIIEGAEDKSAELHNKR